MMFCSAVNPCLLQNQSNARHDQRKIDELLELSVTQLLKYLQADVGARDTGQRVCGCFPIEHAPPADGAQRAQRKDLEDEDEGLVEGTLDNLVQPAHAAPDGDERARESR